MPSSEAAGRGRSAPRSRQLDQADLQAVRGIGPKAAVLLKKAGISDLGQLARTPVNELVAALAGLHGNFDSDRIIRERWLTQAAALAAIPASAELEGETAARPVRHSFTVEVRLAPADRAIVSTKIVHVQTGDEETWADLNPEGLAAFIGDRSQIRLDTPGARPEPEAGPAPVPRPAARPEPGVEPPEPPAAGPGSRKPAVRTYAIVPAAGSADAGGRASAVTATLTFDTAALNLPAGETATVKAVVFARQLLAGTTIPVGDRAVTVGWSEHVTLGVPCDLSAASRPISLFAVIRILTDNGQSGGPAEGLPGAKLTIAGAG